MCFVVDEQEYDGMSSFESTECKVVLCWFLLSKSNVNWKSRGILLVMHFDKNKSHRFMEFFIESVDYEKKVTVYLLIYFYLIFLTPTKYFFFILIYFFQLKLIYFVKKINLRLMSIFYFFLLIITLFSNYFLLEI